MKSAWLIQAGIISLLGLSEECSIVVQIVPLKHKVKTHTKKDHMKEDEESSQTHDNNIPNNILEAVLQLWALPWT